MMTRKDFERIAQVFRVQHDPHGHISERTLWEDLVDDMCVELKAINPLFDEYKFRKACDP